MNRFSTLQACLVLSALLTVPIAQAATMSKGDYRSTKDRIGAEYKADKAARAPLKANAKDICVEEAKAKEKVAHAALTFAKAEPAYALAKEMCDALSGDAKSSCLADAKTKFGKN